MKIKKRLRKRKLVAGREIFLSSLREKENECNIPEYSRYTTEHGPLIINPNFGRVTYERSKRKDEKIRRGI
jgi:hypothetical protein